MYDIEREQRILELLAEKHTISVNRLAKLVYCSGSTIRRDLTRLVKKGLVTRTFGAVSLTSDTTNEETSFLVRENVNVTEKRAICKRAAELLRSNITIFIDSSTTMSYIVPFLNDFKNLLIITNGIKIANDIVSKTNHRVYVVGGELMPHSNSILGSTAINQISTFYADIALLSCAGVTPEFGISEVTSDSAQFKYSMIKNSHKVIVGFDDDKIGSNKAFKTCLTEEVDVVIISKNAAEKYKKAVEKSKEKGVEFITF